MDRNNVTATYCSDDHRSWLNPISCFNPDDHKDLLQLSPLNSISRGSSFKKDNEKLASFVFGDFREIS
jgi:hypothetical protein